MDGERLALLWDGKLFLRFVIEIGTFLADITSTFRLPQRESLHLLLTTPKGVRSCQCMKMKKAITRRFTRDESETATEASFFFEEHLEINFASSSVDEMSCLINHESISRRLQIFLAFSWKIHKNSQHFSEALCFINHNSGMRSEPRTTIEKSWWRQTRRNV